MFDRDAVNVFRTVLLLSSREGLRAGMSDWRSIAGILVDGLAGGFGFEDDEGVIAECVSRFVLLGAFDVGEALRVLEGFPSVAEFFLYELSQPVLWSGADEKFVNRLLTVELGVDSVGMPSEWVSRVLRVRLGLTAISD